MTARITYQLNRASAVPLYEQLMCVGDVWVNGEKTASSEYGYLGFEIDVTDRLRPAGESNTVEVQLDDLFRD